MLPLIDGDILCYELGFAAEAGWQGEGVPSWNYVEELLEARIEDICDTVGATERPLVFLSGEENFRDKIAISRPYKGTRRDNKPWHWKNIRVYLTAVYRADISDGIEADDAMSIYQTSAMNAGYADFGRETSVPSTIICSRDKDLRMVPGWHYSWELGKQPSFGPLEVDEMGWLKYDKQKNKLIGCGLSFFYAQMIMGDTVDNIPGLPKCGPKKAFETLSGRTTPDDLEMATQRLYRDVVGPSWKEYMTEQGQLLWMVRELDENGAPILWMPDMNVKKF